MINQETVRMLLNYDPETGALTWRKNYGRGLAGAFAGRVDNEGYRRVMLKRRSYYAHRLAWLYVYGTFPSGEIDHIDRVRTNNRIANLRDVTRTENAQNTSPRNYGPKRIAHRCSKAAGAVWRKADRKWEANITINRKRHYLGRFATKEAAGIAYQAAAQAHFENHKGTDR
jgi:hypothetical protein